MNQQSNKPQDKLHDILEQLNLKKSEEWEFMKTCEMMLGKESEPYKNTVIRWGQWKQAVDLVNNIINNQ